MTTTVLLVRHGQTESNTTGFYMGRSDEDLSEVGYRQAQRLSSRLARIPIALVCTSPLRRAYITAAILAEPHELEPRVLDDLIEIDLGDWQGLHMDEISQRWPELWQQWRTDPSGVVIPNGENLHEVTERAIPAFHRIVETNQGKQVIIVAHEVIVKVIVANVLGAPNSIYRRYEISNTSLTVIHYLDNKSCLVGLNDTSHL
jgi:broad specificity phosphatase PhoE